MSFPASLPTGATGRALLLALASCLLLSACKSGSNSASTTVSPMGFVAGTTTRNALDDMLEGNQGPPPAFVRTRVDYPTKEAPGTVVIDTKGKFLYLVEGGGKAMRYGVGVGREGFGWKGAVNVNSKQEWPRWHPPKEMIAREKAKGKNLPEMMEGGPRNPLGARALYLWQDNKDTLYRIHGTVEPWTIGTNVSSGCIRLANEDIIDLYDRVPVGAKVIVN